MHPVDGRPRLRHALALRCPLCGWRPITSAWGDIVDTCPGCGHTFAAEEGYWVGALIINMAAVIGVFAVLFGGALLLTWPNVPWNAVTIGCAGAMAATSIWFYPRSKTLWVWLDLRAHPYSSEDAAGR